MKKAWMGMILLAGMGIVAAAIVYRPTTLSTNADNIANATRSVILNTGTVIPGPSNATIIHVDINTNSAAIKETPPVVVPITDFFNRVTKKPFGTYITPKTSPIQPEKFSGYHTGADAETTLVETDADIPIYSIAKGKVVFAGHVNGYGGAMIIQYTINNKVVSGLYGHLRISSFTKKKGETIEAGQQIAVLGTGYTSETDGERKHLHFGLMKGATINYKGYVTTKSALSGWEDPIALLRAHSIP